MLTNYINTNTACIINTITLYRAPDYTKPIFIQRSETYNIKCECFYVYIYIYIMVNIKHKHTYLLSRVLNLPSKQGRSCFRTSDVAGASCLECPAIHVTKGQYTGQYNCPIGPHLMPYCINMCFYI